MTSEEMVAISPFIEWNKEKLSLLKRYYSLLVEWNDKMNLTRIIKEDEVYEKHYFDSIKVAQNLDFSDKKIADVGTGAGFPGIVLAIAFPGSEVTLIESSHKKCLFLEEVKKTLDLPNIHIINARVEELRKERESFDIVISRAVASLPVLLEITAPFVKLGGYFVAMKGEKGEEELLASKHAIKTLGIVLEKKDNSPLPSGDNRLNLYFKKTSKTPSKFPRIYSEIVKSPL